MRRFAAPPVIGTALSLALASPLADAVPYPENITLPNDAVPQAPQAFVGRDPAA